MALKNYMIKPSLNVVNFNIDYKLPKKEVEYNKTQVMMYGQTKDIDKRFPNGKEKVVEPVEGKADPSADIPIFGGALIPISLSAALGKATTNMKAVAGVALSSVNGMAAGLQNLSSGSVTEMIALAKLDAVILEAKAELGEMSVGNKNKLNMGLDDDILKASAIKTPGALGDALSMGDPSGVAGKFAGIDGGGIAEMAKGSVSSLALPSVSKAVDSTGVLRNFNIDKTSSFRDIVENVDVRIESYSEQLQATAESFGKIARKTRVYGSESDLVTKFGNTEVNGTEVRRFFPTGANSDLKATNILSIAKKTWDPIKKWLG